MIDEIVSIPDFIWIYGPGRHWLVQPDLGMP